VAVLAATVLFDWSSMSATVYLDDDATDPRAVAERELCKYMRFPDTFAGAFPLPYTVQGFRAGQGGSRVPDPAKRWTGSLSSCAH
jgi:hypothetical protein